MRRILCALALCAFVAFGITASFRTSDWSKTSGAQLPQRISAHIKEAPSVNHNPFGAILPPMADAVIAGRPWVYDGPINWRTQRDGSFVDSTYVTVSNTDFTSDTTVAYELRNIPFPESYRLGVATTVDSITTFSFCIGGATAAPSIDTVYVGTQVSMDGLSWVTCTVTGGPAGTFLADAFVTGKPAIASAGVIESASSNQMCMQYDVVIPAVPEVVLAQNGSTAPTDQQIYGWRFIRWVVTWSLVDETDVLQAWVGHPAVN